MRLRQKSIMRVAIGSDHGGFERKSEIVRLLQKLGHKVADMGCFSEESCDYPDYAKKVAKSVSLGRSDRGILLCGTGIGMSIAANKFPRVRAAVCWSVKTAALASEHNQANVLCLSGRYLKPSLVSRIAQTWLDTSFGGGRHMSRVKKISQLEGTLCKRPL